MDDTAFLRDQAAKCRRLAALVTTSDVAATLIEMAEEYERRAEALDGGEGASAA